MSAASILNFIDIIGPLIAVIAFMYKSGTLSDELKVIFAFCLVQLVCNSLATYIEIVVKGVNYWVYKLNTVFSFALLLYLFGKHLLPVKKIGSILLIVAFLLINIIPLMYGDGITSYNSVSAALSSLVIVGYCLFYFYKRLILSSPDNSVPSTVIFWCVVGIFTYYAGAFFVFLSYKFLIETDKGTAMTVLWKFHNLLLLICSLYISYGVLCKKYQTIQS